MAANQTLTEAPRTGKTLLSLLLAAAMIFSLSILCSTSASAEGSQHPAAAAKTYTFLCARISADYLKADYGYEGEVLPVRDRYITMYSDSTVTLNANGSGNLNPGDGEELISFEDWSLDGTLLQIQTPEETWNGTIRDNIMTLEAADGCIYVYRAYGADTKAIKPITTDAFRLFAFGIPQVNYRLYAVGANGQIIDAESAKTSSMLTLADDETGELVIDGNNYHIDTWETDDTTITLTLSDGTVFTGLLQNGQEMILLTFDEKTLGYYIPYDRSRVYLLCDQINNAAKVHLRYTVRAPSTGTTLYDVHSRDGILYYSEDTIQTADGERRSAVLVTDGTQYYLKPDEGTAMRAASQLISPFADDILQQTDKLFILLQTFAEEEEYSVETRELDGVSYEVEIFPVYKLRPETAFYFDEEGNLVRIDEGDSTIYTIEGIDDSVDDSLFDLSEYPLS